MLNKWKSEYEYDINIDQRGLQQMWNISPILRDPSIWIFYNVGDAQF